MRNRTTTLALVALLALAMTGSVFAQSNAYEKRGDEYMKLSRYRLASECYKVALKYDPANEALWEKHRQSFERERAVEDYVNRAKEMLAKGFVEDAGNLLQEAVRLNPRDDVLWRMYEGTLVQNPNIAVIRTERDAWDAFKRGRDLFDSGHFEAARRIFGKVAEATRDQKLLYYARDYLHRTEGKLRDFYPTMETRTFHP